MYNECRHIFTSGKKCQSPALKERDFCYFHSNRRKRSAHTKEAYEPYIPPQDTAHDLTPLEDADAIQLALSDVVLALAANRIDPRRARILIYGLQVASQNHRHRVTMAANEQTPTLTVRETHEHEDGTLIGPAQQSPDPEEAAERKRPPSLGEILLRQAEALKAEHQAEEEARKKRQAEKPWEKPQPGIVNIRAAAQERVPHPISSCRSRRQGGSNQSARSAHQSDPLRSTTTNKSKNLQKHTGGRQRCGEHPYPRVRERSNPLRATGDESTILVVGIP